MKAGNSTTAQTYGANIEIKVDGQGLYLVVGRSRLPVGLVGSVGGEVLLGLPSRKLLALLPIEGFFAFQSNPEIELVGPVSVDRERFARFLNSNHPPGETLAGGQRRASITPS